MVRKILYKKLWIQSKIWVKKLFGLKNYLSKNIRSQKIFGPKRFVSNKFFFKDSSQFLAYLKTMKKIELSKTYFSFLFHCLDLLLSTQENYVSKCYNWSYVSYFRFVWLIVRQLKATLNLYLRLSLTILENNLKTILNQYFKLL